MINQQPTT